MYDVEPTAGDTGWFVHDRFGLFVHWGLYAVPARHEWVKLHEGRSDAEYERYAEQFDPDRYDPAEWAAAAVAAGMKYAVITTKHHDGFCLWDTKQTDYKARRDLLRPFVEAFRAAGLRIGFYYSLLDWHHPDFPIDAFHPEGGGVVKRMVEQAGTEGFSFERLAELPDEIRKKNEHRDIRRYAAYAHEQVRELLTGYGRVDIVWYDFSYPGDGPGGLRGKGRDDWDSERLLALTRELQPGIIVNDRLDLPPELADVHTAEQVQPVRWLEVDGRPVVWEACQTFSGSWGYHRDEASWKSPGQLIRMLVNTVACGGNLLMNVGPTARGTFDSRAREALRVYGDWLELHDRAIYGCTASPYTPPPDCRHTQNGDRLYLHVFAWPFLYLQLAAELAGRVRYAALLNDGSEIPLSHDGVLELPVRQPDVVVPVIELVLR